MRLRRLAESIDGATPLQLHRIARALGRSADAILVSAWWMHPDGRHVMAHHAPRALPTGLNVLELTPLSPRQIDRNLLQRLREHAQPVMCSTRPLVPDLLSDSPQLPRAGATHCLSAARRTRDGGAIVLQVCRALRPDQDPEPLLRMMRLALPPARRLSAAGSRLASLPTVQRQTLRLLLIGRSEKQIAAHLGRSRHTVHHHVKQIYRAMNVSSRGELLARFLDECTL
ncbi:MAG TPA: LuxR C-terminal-related transcriptional regulator, partial [Tepidisphaeraceae bacterium]|nr:LuxR C-terminal-related transcriptional regulator [Tepidisphaeraceae bacterium]